MSSIHIESAHSSAVHYVRRRNHVGRFACVGKTAKRTVCTPIQTPQRTLLSTTHASLKKTRKCPGETPDPESIYIAVGRDETTSTITLIGADRMAGNFLQRRIRTCVTVHSAGRPTHQLKPCISQIMAVSFTFEEIVLATRVSQDLWVISSGRIRAIFSIECIRDAFQNSIARRLTHYYDLSQLRGRDCSNRVSSTV